MKFSIIVPVYGVAKYVRECLKSVLEQSYQDWECLCVDDGSTDGSGKILDEFASVDTRFRVIHKKNEGVARTRNTGLERITGDYFLFLDGDDVWHTDLLHICKRVLAEHPEVDVVKFKYKSFGNQANFAPMEELKPSCRIAEITGDYDYCRAGFTACDKAYRRLRFLELRQRSYIVGEDLLYLTQVYLLAKFEAIVDVALYGYRIHDGSAMRRSPTPQQAIDSICYKRDILLAIRASGQRLAPNTAHWIANAMTELFSYEDFYRVSPRNEVCRAWSEALRTIFDNPDLSAPQRLRMRLVASCPYWPIVIPLCWIPCWLKRKGLHR